MSQEARPGPSRTAGGFPAVGELATLIGPPGAERCPCFEVSVSEIFPGRTDQVALARRLVHDALARCQARDDAVLLASELSANAVLHSASRHSGSFGVRLSHDAATVRIEVRDEGSVTVPAAERRAGEAQSGRGLVIVQALAIRWSHSADQSGRLVWCELACQ